MSDVSTLAIFVDDQDGDLGIGLAIAEPSIVEMENGELVVGCKFTLAQAKLALHQIRSCIQRIEHA